MVGLNSKVRLEDRSDTIPYVPKTEPPPSARSCRRPAGGRPLDKRNRPGHTAGVESNQCLRCNGFGHWAVACTPEDLQRAKERKALPRQNQPRREIGADKATNPNWKKEWQHPIEHICQKWNRNPGACSANCGLLHIVVIGPAGVQLIGTWRSMQNTGRTDLGLRDPIRDSQTLEIPHQHSRHAAHQGLQKWPVKNGSNSLPTETGVLGAHTSGVQICPQIPTVASAIDN